VEPALYAQLRLEADAAGMRLSTFIRAILRDYVRNPHPLEREEIHT
jgi:hypothetical protein